MRTTRLAFAFLLLAALAPASASDMAGDPAQQPIQLNPGDSAMQVLMPGRQAKTGTGKLRGRVLAADSGAVVRRAQVRISGSDIGTKTAFTDPQGRYEFKDLPAGRFTVSVTKSGFVTMQYGQSRPFEPGRPIELADGQVMEKADVALPRGSAVQGHIVDEFGEPVAEAAVSAMRMQYSGGRRRLAPMGRNSVTNDQGYFRLYGLPPGEYYLSATVRTVDTMVMDMLGASGAGGPVGSNNNSGYAASYYPGTASPAEAQRVALALGQELSNVDIQMQPVKLARISGVASGSDGSPMTGALVMLMPAMKEAVMLMPGGTSRTDKDGNFTLTGVAPGEYSLQVQSMAALMNAAAQAMSMVGGSEAGAGAPPARPAEREFATATVAVTGEDITGLIVTGTRGAHAAGRLVFDGAAPPDNLSSLRVMAQATDTSEMAAAASLFGNSTVSDRGTFDVDSLVGGRSFRVANLPKGWHFKQLTHEGIDISDRGYDFKPGEEVHGFEIVLTTKTQTVAGAVAAANGAAAKEYTVVVFAEEAQKWTVPDGRWVASARADQQGQFKITDLPPGAYLAIVVEYVPQGEWRDPAWLEQAAKNATRFTLDEGATRTLDLKLGGS
ncbi:MAG TPA: carboxypeptidase-like regulatory domain-containing protein [Vicinamibacterales bacterium]|jgi:protocatechuate 3,4-dioxygenase beta subunit